MDEILLLVSTETWKGTTDDAKVREALNLIHRLPDPDRKLRLVAQHFGTEHGQRNAGLELLRARNVPWCLIIDDDEIYETEKLREFVRSLPRRYTAGVRTALASHLIYWKTPEWVIADPTPALPTLTHTSDTYFNLNRNVVVKAGLTWETLPVDELLCHHYSYVRTDEEVRSKVSTTSHADEYPYEQWLREVWDAWHPEMENLHPNHENRSSFRKAVPAETLKWKLHPSFRREVPPKVWPLLAPLLRPSSQEFPELTGPWPRILSCGSRAVRTYSGSSNSWLLRNLCPPLKEGVHPLEVWLPEGSLRLSGEPSDLDVWQDRDVYFSFHKD